MKRGLILAVCLVAMFSLTGFSCSGNTHQSSQAKVTDHSAGNVSQMPSGYRNFAYKCVKIQGMWFVVFTTSDGGSNNNLPSGITAVQVNDCKHFGS